MNLLKIIGFSGQDSSLCLLNYVPHHPGLRSRNPMMVLCISVGMSRSRYRESGLPRISDYQLSKNWLTIKTMDTHCIRAYLNLYDEREVFRNAT